MWRNVALATPGCWTTFRIDLDLNEKSYRAARQKVERLRGQVKWQASCVKEKPLDFSSLIRCPSIPGDLSGADAFGLHGEATCSMSALRNAYIRSWEESSDYVYGSDGSDESLMFGWVFDQNNHLERKAQNEHLTYLTLQGHSVKPIWNNADGTPNRIDLPNLKSLVLNLAVTKPFLQAIHCPKVTFFGFIRWGSRLKEEIEVIPHLVSEKFPVLKRLALGINVFNDFVGWNHDLHRYTRFFPSVEELIVVRSRAITDVYSQSNSNEVVQRIFPNLHSLTIAGTDSNLLMYSIMGSAFTRLCLAIGIIPMPSSKDAGKFLTSLSNLEVLQIGCKQPFYPERCPSWFRPSAGSDPVHQHWLIDRLSMVEADGSLLCPNLTEIILMGVCIAPLKALVDLLSLRDSVQDGRECRVTTQSCSWSKRVGTVKGRCLFPDLVSVGREELQDVYDDLVRAGRSIGLADLTHSRSD